MINSVLTYIVIHIISTGLGLLLTKKVFNEVSVRFLCFAIIFGPLNLLSGIITVAMESDIMNKKVF